MTPLTLLGWVGATALCIVFVAITLLLVVSVIREIRRTRSRKTGTTIITADMKNGTRIP